MMTTKRTEDDLIRGEETVAAALSRLTEQEAKRLLEGAMALLTGVVVDPWSRFMLSKLVAEVKKGKLVRKADDGKKMLELIEFMDNLNSKVP